MKGGGSIGRIIAGFGLVLVAGCTSVSSNYTGEITKTTTKRLYVCHGYNCSYKTRLTLTERDGETFGKMFSYAETAADERGAISQAVQYFEDRAGGVIGVRDRAKSNLAGSRVRGQMDCIDESTNTRSLLLYLQERGLLKHHTVEWNRSRGLFVDGRYPHSTAMLRERGGTLWAVDSWFEPMGGAPDIMLYSEWRSRGVMGER